jgi:hypothetical protein
MLIVQRAALAYAAMLGLAFAAAGLVGCAPHVGDHCNQNSDCSLQGTLQCDTSQPNGYCTLFNCTGNSCPSNAACVALNASVPGCMYDDYLSPSRTVLPMCLWTCSKDSDCRTSEGYVCRDPTQPPWRAVNLDNESRMVCLVDPSFSSNVGPAVAPDGQAPVCMAAGPAIDGSIFPGQEASVPAPAPADSGPQDAGLDGAGADGSGAVDAATGG